MQPHPRVTDGAQHGLLISGHFTLVSHSDNCTWEKKGKIPGTKGDAGAGRQADGEGHRQDADNVYYGTIAQRVSFLALNYVGVCSKL